MSIDQAHGLRRGSRGHIGGNQHTHSPSRHYKSKDMFRTYESAKRHYGRKCAISDCWHWCPNCGAYWCHFIDAKGSLDTFVRICFSDSTDCLAPHNRDVVRIDGRVVLADAVTDHCSPVPLH